MPNDTMIMAGSLFCLLLLNTFIFLYNQAPIEEETFTDTGVSIDNFQTGLNESGLNENSSGLKAMFGIGKFFVSLVVLLFGYFTNFPLVVNLLIKLGTYIFALPLFITVIRMVRGN